MIGKDIGTYPGIDLLIFGANGDASLGGRILDAFPGSALTAGVTPYEDFDVNAADASLVKEVLDRVRPRNIVVTVGVNIGAPIGDVAYGQMLRRSLHINCYAVMNVLDAWVSMGSNRDGQFVAISSNSAHVARRNSAAYCASKAALSMAIRCAARELAGRPLVYGYEFGLLAGTPMTARTQERFSGPGSRMVGAENGLDAGEAAGAVVQNLQNPWHGLNGTMLRLDAGEQ